MGDAPGRTGTYDAIVAGASFAGLATALQLRGRVLVLDHRPVGDGQTSACGTTLAAIEAMDARHTVQQVHRHLVLHLAPARGRPRVLRYRLPYAFCTFDYRALCQTLAARAAQRGVEFARVRVTGWRDDALQTDAGPLRARMVVDATGWRAALAGSIDPGHVRRDRLSCGLEAELPQPASDRADGLHFWAGQGTVWPGYAWSFPCGPAARLGVIAYPERGTATSKALREALDAFLDGPGAAYWSPDGVRPWRTGEGAPTQGRHLHGGFLPCAPRPAVVGPVFVVGDAAGHCFGLTGEGIRPALAFAVRCGWAIQQSLDGAMSADEARAAYRRYVAMRLPYLQLMRGLQATISRMGDRLLAGYSLSAYPGPVFRFLLEQYLLPADPGRMLR
ncbi:MAG TPA: NAD(P)/FAD-dependent oxidoreductase [Chloroflexota bacterium]|jgi:flavin-dependent dehydrogenase|nr:NAD(P)/FAD-dependent oxidoreductase [Chloroflexota bacterium]